MREGVILVFVLDNKKSASRDVVSNKSDGSCLLSNPKSDGSCLFPNANSACHGVDVYQAER